MPWANTAETVQPSTGWAGACLTRRDGERCDKCDGTGNDLGRISVHRAPRGFWTAHFSKFDDLSLTGIGATKDLAVNDLIEHADELGFIDFQAGHALPVDEVRL